MVPPWESHILLSDLVALLENIPDGVKGRASLHRVLEDVRWDIYQGQRSVLTRDIAPEMNIRKPIGWMIIKHLILQHHLVLQQCSESGACSTEMSNRFCQSTTSVIGVTL